jgi:hypothetical protein
MRSRYLPETDIANWAFLPPSLKEKFLVAWLRPRQAKGSYDPYRQTTGDAVNRQLPLYPTGQVATPWTMLEALVARKCKGDDRLLEMNLPIAKATHEFAIKGSLTAEPIEVGSLILAHGQRYDFGVPLILRYGGSASIMFPDLRRTGQLTPHGRRVVLSAMHQRFRVNYPEYASLGLEIWRYQDNDARTIAVFPLLPEPLYTYDELSRDFMETYAIMNRLRGDADAERRRRGGEDLGPLFGRG